MTLLLWSDTIHKLGKTEKEVVDPCPWEHTTFMYMFLYGHMLSFFLGIFYLRVEMLGHIVTYA